MHRLGIAPLLLTLIAAGVEAQQQKRVRPAGVALKVLRAIKAKDNEALVALAKSDNPDPWLVADILLSRGKHDAALAFAKAAPRKDVEKLPAYVESRRGKPDNARARKALAAWERAYGGRDAAAALAALRGAEGDARDVAAANVLFARGSVLRVVRRLEQAAKAFAAAADMAEQLGWLSHASESLQWAGLCSAWRSDPTSAAAFWERKLRLEEVRKDRAALARTIGNLARAYKSLGDTAKSLEYDKRVLKIFEELGDRRRVAQALGNLGSSYRGIGDYPRAREYMERSLAIATELGDRATVAAVLDSLGRVYTELGEFQKALEFHHRALLIAEELGDRSRVVGCLSNIGRVHLNLADYGRAKAYIERYRKICIEIQNRHGEASAFTNLGLIHENRGEYAKALACQERALKLYEQMKVPSSVAYSFENIGNVHSALGAYELALTYQQRALEMRRKLGDRLATAQSLGNLAIAHGRLGAHEREVELYKQALEIRRELGDRVGICRAHSNMGGAYGMLKDHTRALQHRERALELATQLGVRRDVATALSGIASAHASLGDLDKAVEFRKRAIALANELGLLSVEVHNLWALSRLHRQRGDAAAAVKTARLGVQKVSVMVGGLAEEQGATASDQWEGLLLGGVFAAYQLNDPKAAFFFLESGRAGALLESLGSRDSLRDVAIPEELREEEQAARAAVLGARVRQERARKTRKRKEIRAARKALEDARGKLLEVVARIQRAAKSAADVVYPKAADLEAVQAELAADEALVVYVSFEKNAGALVVTRGAARPVRLFGNQKVDDALAKLALHDPETDPASALAILHDFLVKPLQLEAATRRVLVAPHKNLAYLPFTLLMRGRDVTYVPSGSTYLALRAERTTQGKDVLALGDPDYASNSELASLPATRDEAKSVGDVVLLGKDATETALGDALKQRARWRAVHLACHGLLDTERPLLSSLALTPGGGADGFLTTAEVFRMRISADLVVLSACETGRGKVFKTEGIVGFTRAFMLAGAPRVIVSLWKVDDDATRALMTKFYELWRPGKMSTAGALKQAQEFVRGHKKWKHPYFWAAWQLWGLGD